MKYVVSFNWYKFHESSRQKLTVSNKKAVEKFKFSVCSRHIHTQAFLPLSHLYQSVNNYHTYNKSLIKILTRFGTRLRINIEGFVSHRSRWKGLPKEFIVVLILLLYLFLSPQPHTKANIGFETKPKRYHRVPCNYKTIIIIYFLHTGFKV